jgi:hypothetical protein
VADHVDLAGLDLVLRRYEARGAERERCGQLRLVIAKALVAERNRDRRDRLSSMLRRVEALLVNGGQAGVNGEES